MREMEMSCENCEIVFMSPRLSDMAKKFCELRGPLEFPNGLPETRVGELCGFFNLEDFKQNEVCVEYRKRVEDGFLRERPFRGGWFS